jgi:starch-binding outer membrane protein, SusD/RagB family
MKKLIYKSILLAMLVLSFASCKKFLEKEPIGRVGKNVLFEDVLGAKVALTGAYKSMLNYYKLEYGMHGDVASDNVVNIFSNDPFMLQSFNFSSTSGDDALVAGHIWLAVFETLNNTNNILNAIPNLKAEFPNQLNELDAIEGQALVIRAICHLDLSKVYAQPYNFTPDASHLGVPVLTKTPSPGAQVPRKTMKQTYDQILSDLNAALPYLNKYNNATDQALVSYQAALGLLSRVYLYKGDWENSVKAANLIIEDTKYSLATASEYKSVFQEYPGISSVKKEVLFQLSALGFTKVSTKEIMSIFSAPSVTVAQYGASSKLINLFDTNDIRNNMFGDVGGYHISKKYTEGSLAANTPYTIKVIRLSEVYLNRAEANWNLKKYPEAAEDLRIISQRAHPSQTIVINYASPADLYQQIADERNRELCFEGHRLYDIVRRKENLQRGNDCNSTVCLLTYPNNKFVLPITTKELDANKALQPNPGYN